MAYFPFFINLKQKKCIIIGGGTVAFRKAMALLEFEADITVLAPDFVEEILALRDRLTLLQKEYQEEDLVDAFCVIAATNQPEINWAIARYCKDKGILINVVDEPELCSFFFPAYVKSGDITIGVTTSGKSPVMAGEIKKTIQDTLPDYYGDLVKTLGSYREMIKERIPFEKDRAAIFKELARIGIEQGGKLCLEDVEAVIKGLGGSCHNGENYSNWDQKK